MSADERTIATQLEEALAQTAVFDPHTHLVGDKLGARGLHDILLYHMMISDLYAAGCPSGNRLTEYSGWPSQEEAYKRIHAALPFLPQIQNTSTFWGVRIILRDLYGWVEPITLSNWRKLDGMIRERADDGVWHRSVLDRARISRSCTELARRGAGGGDDRLQYALEWAMFARCQWGEYDTALYDLERTWGRQPESPAPIGRRRPPTDQVIRSLTDVHAAIEHYVGVIPYDVVISTAMGLSGDIDYRLVSESEMESAIVRRDQATEHERDIYASYILEAFLAALEKKAGDRIVFQFSAGAEPLPYETASLLPQRTISQMAEIIGRHPRLRFQCFLGSRHGNQSLCTLARELPNFSLAGYWWHNFFPDTIRQVISERLDMVPLNKQVGFFSDAYCVEWTYGKLMLVRKQLAAVLALKVDQGQYAFADATAIAQAILYETPRALLGMTPRGEPLAKPVTTARG